MSEEEGPHAVQRSWTARAGVTALNLIAPGLGLLRGGNWRSGLLFLLAPFPLAALMTIGFGNLPIVNFAAATTALIAVLATFAALYLIPIVLTWRESAVRTSAAWWSRWYGLTLTAAIMMGLSQCVPMIMHRFYKPFYAPSVSMAPTIRDGDKFVVDMRWRGPLLRGEVIVFQSRGVDRVSRIAGIAGDNVAMRGGMPLVNGRPVTQQPLGSEVFADYDGPRRASVLLERLPGETSSHHVLNVGLSEFDEMRELVVPAGHIFVLGDNRDRAVDSRVPSYMGGVGMVPVTAIVGRPMFIHWSSDRAKVGTRLDR